MADETRKQLREAWDTMIAEFERARDAIDQPDLMPAPDSDRNLAEGYRYLLGKVHSAIERAFHADVDHPFMTYHSVLVALVIGFVFLGFGTGLVLLAFLP